MNKDTFTIVFIIIALGVVAWFFFGRERFELPVGESVLFEKIINNTSDMSEDISQKEPDGNLDFRKSASNREVFVTDNKKHSIPLDEILSGGPPKDGIPSIDKPKFVSIDEANAFLTGESIGLGFIWKKEARFYPYQILVWHEIVNDEVQNDPILVTYCPLCATGVVFDRRIDGVGQEFGVSGLLWKSNLLMYNRTGNADTESLWSQVLGEAVLGPETGEKLAVLRSDTVRYGAWKEQNPTTKVLSRDTGTSRSYGSDPYGSYYTDESVSFGATFSDTRLHPKAFVIGIEVKGKSKAYPLEALSVGVTEDTFAGEKIIIQKSAIDEVDILVGESQTLLSTIDGFWFSWLAVHEDTELYQK